MINLITDLISFTQPTNLDRESLSVIESIAKIKKVVNECITQFNNLEKKTDEDYNKFLKQIKDYKNYIENLCKQYRNETLEIIQEFKELIKALEDIEETIEWIKKQSEFVQDLAKQNQDAIDKGTIVTKDEINKIENGLLTGKFPIKNKLKGASVYLPIPNGQPPFEEILDKLIYSNCNTISICPILWMDSAEANNISGFKNGMTLNDVKTYFIKAKEKGLNVILKPHVGGNGFNSWSSIKPSNVEMWITNYSNFYNSMVDELINYIDIFCISNELKGQTNNLKNLWVNLINSLKAKKDIPVISAITISESTTNVFLDKLDYIGFNMYCPVEGDMSTDINQQIKSIFRLKPYINQMFNIMSKYNKKAIITEVGILPFEVSLQNPELWGFDTEPPTKYEVQQRYYNIAVKEFLYANNIMGVMVWNACDGFTFINRPAQETLKEIYGGIK